MRKLYFHVSFGPVNNATDLKGFYDGCQSRCCGKVSSLVRSELRYGRLTPIRSNILHKDPNKAELRCRAILVGIVAIGSKAAVLAKSAGGASGVLKGAGALMAAGKSSSQFYCAFAMPDL